MGRERNEERAKGQRILFVARNIPLPGFRENDIILQLADKLEASGYSVSVVFPSEYLPVPGCLLGGISKVVKSLGNRFTICGRNVDVVKYLRLPGVAYSYLLAEFFLPRKLQVKPDWVHAHYALPDGMIGKAFARKYGCPLIVTVRAGDMRKWSLAGNGLLSRQIKDVLREADIVYAPSPSLLEDLKARGVNARLLPHAVELPMQDTSGFRKAPGLLVFCAASLLPLKHIDWLIQAMVDLPPHARLDIAGAGPERANLLALVDRLGLRDRVRLLGQLSRDSVFKCMDSAHVFALPSVSETFGLAYLEAGARECAILACRGTGVDGCFVDGEEAVFCDANAADVSQQLQQLCWNATLRESVAKRGYERVRESYQWSSVVGHYISQVWQAKQC